MNVTTSTANGSVNFTAATVYYAIDEELLRAIEEVKRTARKWKRDCTCSTASRKTRRFCESYGCASLDELLAPLSRFKISRKRKK